MKTKLSLMAAMIGLAMLATPIAAAAKDHHSYDYVRAQGGYAAPVFVNKHDFRHGATWAPAPRAYPVHDWRDRGWHDGYRGYGSRGYYPAPVYAAPAPVYGYGPGYGYRNPCQRAGSVMYNYQKDRATGHPAAAYDLLRQNQWVLHSGCGAGAAPYGYGGGYGRPYGGSSLLQYFR
jgi:hypothetical protein